MLTTLTRALRSTRMLLLQTVAGVMNMCAGVTSIPPAPSLIRLPAVPGNEPSRANDVLLCPARETLTAKSPHHVIYFPGDVQSYRDVMANHPENFLWACWSLEDIAAVLSRRFPNSCIWIVKPSRMHLHKFSCYDHFVESNMFGAPKHSVELGAFRQLHSLLVNAFTLAQNVVIAQHNKHGDCDIPVCDTGSVYTANGCPAETERVIHCAENSAIHFGSPSVKDSASFTVIGFSKGCVVLNQLLYELHQAKKDTELNSFLANIEAMYWLDGGHSGGSETWITCPDILKVFAQTGIAVHAHVTPYQVSDSMRSWIGKEHMKFVQILKDYGVKVKNQLHFSDEIPSLDNHFRVHEVF